MSEVVLMIRADSVTSLTLFNGNIDFKNIRPLIFTAQTTYLKSFLGLKLYTKVYNDFVNDALSGDYLVIFEEYIKDLLSYKTAELYVTFGRFKVNENGIHTISNDNLESINENENNALILKYNGLISNVEANFKQFVTGIDLVELREKDIKINSNHPWL